MYLTLQAQYHQHSFTSSLCSSSQCILTNIHYQHLKLHPVQVSGFHKIQVRKNPRLNVQVKPKFLTYQQYDPFKDEFRLYTHIEELKAQLVKLFRSKLIQYAIGKKHCQVSANTQNCSAEKFLQYDHLDVFLFLQSRDVEINYHYLWCLSHFGAFQLCGKLF